MHARSCPLCQSTQARFHCRVGDVDIFKCSTCTFLYRLQIPEDLKAMYDEAYYRSKSKEEAQWAGSGDYIADQERLLRSFDEHVADLEKLKKPARLLDVGCAAGFLLEAARRRGWQVTGLDISDFAAQYARDAFHLDIRIGMVENIGFDAGSFDVVTAFEYIEHVMDPVATLKAIRPWIKKDGMLVLTTPNAGGWQAKHHPDQFDGFREWRPLTYFSRKTMAKLLSISSFEPVSIRTDQSIVTRQALSKAGVKEPERLRALVNRVAPRVKVAIRRVAGRLWEGSSMKVYAKPI